MPFNPVPLCLEAVARLLPFPVPLRLGTYGKGCKWMSVVCLWLALSLVLQNPNEIRQLRPFPVPLLIWRGVARAVNDCAPCAFGSLSHPVLPHLDFMAMGGVQMLAARFCSAQAIAVPSHSSASGDAEQGLPIDVRRAAWIRANSSAAE